jgi:hypothetical protein
VQTSNYRLASNLACQVEALPALSSSPAEASAATLFLHSYRIFGGSTGENCSRVIGCLLPERIDLDDIARDFQRAWGYFDDQLMTVFGLKVAVVADKISENWSRKQIRSKVDEMRDKKNGRKTGCVPA